MWQLLPSLNSSLSQFDFTGQIGAVQWMTGFCRTCWKWLRRLQSPRASSFAGITAPLGGKTLLRASARHGSESCTVSLTRSCSSESNYVLTMSAWPWTVLCSLPTEQIRAVLSPAWLSCMVQPSEFGAGPPNLLLHIYSIIIIFLLAPPFQAAGEAEMLLLPGEEQAELWWVPVAGGVGLSRYCRRRKEHGMRRRLNLWGKEQSSQIAGKRQ